MLFDEPKSFREEQESQVKPFNPLHGHDTDSAKVNEVLYDKQVLMLDPRDPSGDLGDSSHRFFISRGVGVAFRRKCLNGYRQREAV